MMKGVQNSRPVPQVTAIVTAYHRVEALRQTLTRLAACEPPPAEILVHVDGGLPELLALLRAEFPAVRLYDSQELIGPGGARNLLIKEARCRWVASFDDDSSPVDADYFARVERLMNLYPQANLLAAKIYLPGEAPADVSRTVEWGADFVGCGCVYLRESFLRTTGYVPLPLAYGMEEVDLALRMCAAGQKILQCAELRVLHDTAYQHHQEAAVTAAGIINSALHAFLRYPVLLWPLGLAQCLRRLWWLLREERLPGIASGLLGIPRHLWRYRTYRAPVGVDDLVRYQRLRRQPELVSA